MRKHGLKAKKKENRAALPSEKRHSAGEAAVRVVPPTSPLWAEDEVGPAPSGTRKPEIQVISPVYFKNHRGEVFEQARDGEAVFVIKRHSKLMAIVCGYTPENLAAVLGETPAEIDAEVTGDPMKQRVSVEEILSFVKQRGGGKQP